MSAMLAIAIKDLRTFTPPARLAVLHVHLAALRRRAVRRAVRRQRQADAAAAHRGGGRGQDRRPHARLPIDWSSATRSTRTHGAVAPRRSRRCARVERTAAVILRPGFGEASSRMFYGTPPEVQLYTDPSRQAERGMLEGLLMQQGAERMQSMFSNPSGGRQNVQNALQDLQEGRTRREPRPRDVPRPARHVPRLRPTRRSSARRAVREPAAAGAGWEPLRITKEDLQRQRTGPRNGYDVTFPQAMLWAVFGCVMAFGTTFASERVRGTLVRLHVSPLSRHRCSPASRWRPCWPSASSSAC